MRKRRLAEEDDGEDSENGAVKGDHPTDQARSTRTSKLVMSKNKEVSLQYLLTVVNIVNIVDYA